MAVTQPFWNQKKMVLFARQMLQLQCNKAILNTKIKAGRGEELPNNGINSSGSMDITEEVRTLCMKGQLKEALDILGVMDQQGIRADWYTYDALLQGCLNMRALPEGKLVHAHMIDTGFNADIFLQTKLVIMYAKCGSLVDGRRALDGMPQRNVVSWTAMIAAYSKHGYDEEALTLFYQMQRTGIQPDQFTFASVLPACASLGDLKHGRVVHEGVIRAGFQSNVFVGSALIDMYMKCGIVEDARQVFDKTSERNVVLWNAIIAGYAQNRQVEKALELFQKMPQRDMVSWNAMVAGYVQNGHFDDALNLFRQMQQVGSMANPVSFATVLPACANLATLEHGKEVHADIIRTGFHADVYVGSALIDMYIKCGTLEDARKAFDEMAERNVVSWNTMIGGYAQSGYVDEALKLFQKLPEQDTISWNAMIAGYAQHGHVVEASKLFQKMPKQNVVSWTVMISGYAQNGHIDEAQELFRKMPERDVISWNAIVAGYAQNGKFGDALKLFQEMQLAGVKADSVSFASVLPACANLGALEHGKEVHEDIIRNGFQSDIIVGNALVDMYAKCGSIEDARKVFDNLSERVVASWNVMIVGYAMHGCSKEALRLFRQMQYSGMKPNEVTFVGVLSACCHVGLVDDGWQYFDCMSRDYNITPAVEHYCCMVDLLGRSGCLDEAQDFINRMPMKPDAAVWRSLLAACRIHGNLGLGKHVAERLFETDPVNAAHYVLLSNIYAAVGRWADAEKVRKLMKDKKVKKMPGCSWIEVNNKVYAFRVGDKSHPEAQKIYAKLETLSGQMREAGYVPDKNFVLHDVEEEQKEGILCHHSEKLAIVFGLLNTSSGTPIRIVKNLRVCGDCHSATKFISKIAARKIVVRDANRFHHFMDGQCSCRDYW